MPNFIFSSYLGDSVGIIADSKYFLSGEITFNALILLGTMLTFFSAFFLLKYTLKHFPPYDKYNILLATIGSIIIVISPLRIRYSMEWPNHANWAWIILYVYFLLRYIKKPGSFSYALLSGLALGISLISNAYHGVELLLLSIPLFTYGLYRYFIENSFKYTYHNLKTLVSLLIFIITISSFGLYFYNKMTTPVQIGTETIDIITAASRGETDRWAYSARPWHYLIPDINNNLLGTVSVKLHYWIWDQKPYYLTEVFFPKEHSLFLGYTTLLLLLYLLLTRIKMKKNGSGKSNYFIHFFLLLWGSAFIFSMPPYVSILNHKIYFPSHFLYYFFPQIRAYARFGAFVFIANTALAIISMKYIAYTIDNTKKISIIICMAIILIFIEFFNYPFLPLIYTTPTKPYVWLANQGKTFNYIEIPRRTDYSDFLYKNYHDFIPLNYYLLEDQKITLIEDSLWHKNFAKPDSLWCKDFQELNGRYIFYHKKDLNKQKVVEQFKQTGVVTQELKVAMAESWGQPVWGNHVPLTEKDLFRQKREQEMEQLLTGDPKFILVKKFSREEIATERPNKNFSADKFDKVLIFELNQDYCNTLSLGSNKNNE